MELAEFCELLRDSFPARPELASISARLTGQDVWTVSLLAGSGPES